MCRQGAVSADAGAACQPHGQQLPAPEGGAGEASQLPAAVARGFQSPATEGDAVEAPSEASAGAGGPGAGSEADPAPAAQRYEPLSVVGNGAYGTVFLARDRDTNEQVAIKRVDIDDDQEDGVPANLLREVSLLLDFAHPNVVQLRDLQITSPAECELVFEYVPDDLHRILKDHRRAGSQLPMAIVKHYLAGLLSGIHACHVNMIIHRDLKPPNILIHPVDGVKICDFGLARALSIPVCHQYTPEVITLWYRSPELILGSEPRYGPEVDIWSAGCIFAEMATGYPTFPGDSEVGTVFKIMQLLGSPTEATWPGFERHLTHWSPSYPRWPPTDFGPIREERPELGEAGMDLVRALLALDPASRPTAQRARAHAFLS